MEANTEAIVRLAWARILGLPDDALTQPGVRLVTRASDEQIMYVRLWEQRALVAPAWFLDRADAMDDAELGDPSALLAASVGHGARLVGAATLAYRDAYVKHPALESVTVTSDPVAVVDLEKSCPPDDVAEVGLAEMATALVTLDELDRTTAGAGFDEWQGIIAHLGVLTPPGYRRRGHGLLAAALATNEALDTGLVPQWRARTERTASRGLAARLGFAQVGTQTTLALPGDPALPDA